MWQDDKGRVLTTEQAWASLRETPPPAEEFEARCMYCRHLVAHVVWEYRRLPYRLWVWRRRLMIRVAKWRLRKFDECPQCAFNAGPRWVGFPE